MTKWLIGLLLLANIVFFAAMRWGGMLTTDTDVPSVQAEINRDKIRLLGDVATASSVAVAMVEAKPSAASSFPASAPALTSDQLPPAKARKQCTVEWGEFSGSGLTQVQTALAALKLGDRETQRTVEYASGFWVYIPPLKNHTEVQRKIGQLKALGINDYFVVHEEGTWLNAISLGVFRTEESAQRFLAGLRNKGVRTAKVGERKSKLKFTVFVLKDLDAAAADKIRTLQKNFPDSEQKISDCD
jgi:hypothetical protein